jgi:hypothetical protein
VKLPIVIELSLILLARFVFRLNASKLRSRLIDVDNVSYSHNGWIYIRDFKRLALLSVILYPIQNGIVRVGTHKYYGLAVASRLSGTRDLISPTYDDETA